eukprot:TRINITY_DN8376_c0_g1_i1.p1 TRINITY_DN8376_c0_g1~~TRINITY_DN8376_c0_g1_i1.p1  ORF type:complete len:240 (+),score=52.73 TRINITY_DN8376_c0_g1_i1:253-972(+)
MLEGQEEINPKRLQINLTPFLEKKTPGFVKELWDLLLSAQDNIGGIPTIILEEKQRELLRLKEQNERANQLIQEARFRNTNNNNGTLAYGLNERGEVKTENAVIKMEERRDDKERGSRHRDRDRDRRDRDHRDRRDRDRDRDRHRDKDRDRHRRSRRSRSRSRSRDRHRRHRSRSPHSDSDRDEKRNKKDKSSRHRHHHKSSKDKEKKEDVVKEESNEQLEELRRRALETMKEERTTTE